jgi:hypothetical protein
VRIWELAPEARLHLTFAYHIRKKRTPFDLDVYWQRRLQAAPAVSARSEQTPAGEAPSNNVPSPVSSKEAAELVSRSARRG